MLDGLPDDWSEPEKSPRARRGHREIRDEDKAATCDGKETFAGPGLAHEVAERRKVPCEVYRCPACQQWHLGGPIERRSTFVRQPEQRQFSRQGNRKSNLIKQPWGQG